MDFLQQQAKFDAFLPVFNNERPDEALDMKCPVELYKASTRQYRGIPELSYPFHDRTALWLPAADGSAFSERKLTSTLLSQVKR